MGSAYSWVITKDLISNGEDVGRMGPHNCELDAKDVKENGKKFTMYDDDGGHYYTGFIIGKYDGFEPLDDFGTPNAGCTEIKYSGETL